MGNQPRRIVPGTPSGWTGVGLGFGLLAIILLLFIVSDNVTNGGSTMAPVWLRILVIAGVMVVAVPAVVLGLRSLKTDRSILGTAALVIASVLGGWTALTGVIGLFME